MNDQGSPINESLEFHIEQVVAGLLALGCTPDEVFTVHLSILETVDRARRRKRPGDGESSSPS